MENLDLGGMFCMLGGLQQRMKDMQEKGAGTTGEGTAGGNLVKVVATCDQKLVSITIDPAAMDDSELLEDLVKAAANEALRLGRERMMSDIGAATGGMIPPGLLPGFP